jgi:hypothetical protein
MLQYIYLAVAVIVVLGVAITGWLLIRRGRKAEQEEFAVAFAPDELAVDEGEPLAEAIGVAPEPAGVLPLQPVGEVAAQPQIPAGAYVPSSIPAGPNLGVEAEGGSVPGGPNEPQYPPGSDYLRSAEQLLAEWRAKHEASDPNNPAEDLWQPLTAASFRSQSSPHAAGPTDFGPASHALELGASHVSPPGRGAAFSGADYAASAEELLADPLGVVILDLVKGKGKLTGQDLKRLEVFRPERIELASQTMELPPGLPSNGEAALRLAQIQLYAATLGLRSRWAVQALRAAENGGSTVPFSARDFKLKMARDIMALPTPDRAEVIGYLLGGVGNADGSSPELKRAIIDTLEHLHSAALTNVLLDCLDDPDPIIQEYALAAADRLLEE